MSEKNELGQKIYEELTHNTAWTVSIPQCEWNEDALIKVAESISRQLASVFSLKPDQP